jgi:hypothetical protein
MSHAKFAKFAKGEHNRTKRRKREGERKGGRGAKSGLVGEGHGKGNLGLQGGRREGRIAGGDKR